MEKYQKYNKRRRSITEFRSSYSDNKKYFISTDRKSSWMPVVKYITIAIFFIVFEDIVTKTPDEITTGSKGSTD